MKYFLPFLVIISVHYNVVIKSLKLFRSSINHMSKMTTTSTSSSQLYSLGTDMLQRPDDEDSPEFKEYLRQLMVMQANRAKLGYMAPSSSSSDVYVAKLNRIKLEKERLRELGYPNVEIDMSYKESDYKAAVYEAQEPTVSASGGLSIKPLPDSVYGLPESDEEILARSNIGGRSINNNNNQKVDDNNTAAVALPSATGIPPSVVINEAPPTFTKRGGQKARSLSSEEIEATRAAEVNVKAFLADKKNVYLKDAATSASSAPTTASAPVNTTPVMPSIINPLLPKGATMNPQITNFLEGQIKNQNSNDPNFNLIDTLLAKSGVVIPKTPVKSALTAASNLNTVGNHKLHNTSHSSTTQTTGSKDSPSYAAAQKQALLQKQQLQQQSKILHPQASAAAVVASSPSPPVQRSSHVKTQPINAVSKPVSSPPQRQQQSPLQQQQPQRTVQPPAAPAVMPQTVAKKEYIQQKKQQPIEPVVPISTASTSTAAVSLNGKMSQKDELMVGEAVQWIVKHRGGGPYGAGRLQSPADVLAMETALLNTVAILKADRANIAAAQASVTPAIPLAAAVAARTVRPPAVSVAPVRAALSQQQQQQVVRPPVAAVVRPPPPPQQVVKPAVVSPGPPPAQQQPQQQKSVGLGAFLESMEKKPAAAFAAVVSDSSSANAGAVSMPIALGLDAFLANHQGTSMEEMTALRDGLIDCLALLSNHIRAAAANGVTLSAPAAPAVSGSPATVALLSDNSKQLPLDQELKLTLGLLLKHRGGPGFGHGRLDGAELTSMSTRLRSIAHTLASEAAAAAVPA